MPSRLARLFVLALFMTLAGTASALQVEKKTDPRFDGKTIAEWITDLDSAETTTRRMAAFALA